MAEDYNEVIAVDKREFLYLIKDYLPPWFTCFQSPHHLRSFWFELKDDHFGDDYGGEEEEQELEEEVKDEMSDINISGSILTISMEWELDGMTSCSLGDMSILDTDHTDDQSYSLEYNEELNPNEEKRIEEEDKKDKLKNEEEKKENKEKKIEKLESLEKIKKIINITKLKKINGKMKKKTEKEKVKDKKEKVLEEQKKFNQEKKEVKEYENQVLYKKFINFQESTKILEQNAFAKSSFVIDPGGGYTNMLKKIKKGKA